MRDGRGCACRGGDGQHRASTRRRASRFVEGACVACNNKSVCVCARARWNKGARVSHGASSSCSVPSRPVTRAQALGHEHVHHKLARYRHRHVHRTLQKTQRSMPTVLPCTLHSGRPATSCSVQTRVACVPCMAWYAGTMCETIQGTWVALLRTLFFNGLQRASVCCMRALHGMVWWHYSRHAHVSGPQACVQLYLVLQWVLQWVGSRCG